MAQKPDPAAVHVPFPPTPPNLTIGAELNKGAWGVVYNGDLGGRTVAVKRIHDLLQQSADEQERRKLFDDFREECKKLQTLDHPHVVGFIGAYNDPRLGPILIMEKMQENLRQFLQKLKKKLQVPKQLRISLEIVRGVAFLHQQTPPLVHRDLNDKNVMFSFEGVIKIGDFGQSKLKKDVYLTTDNPGMVTFMPPEALKPGQSKYTESLDIFSVGVLLMEIGTQQEPQVNLHGIGTVREVKRREGDLKVLGEDHPLKPLVLLCLKDKPKERPKASDLQREVLAMVDGRTEHETTKKEFEAAKLKVNQKMKTLHENHQATLMKMDEEIGGLKDEIRGLKPIAEQYRVLFTQHKELQSRFESIMVTNRHVQQVVHEMQGEKTAADSRLRELRTVVNQVTAENEALNQQNAKLKQQIEGFERMFSGMNSKSQALEAENTQLREAICLPDMQVPLVANSEKDNAEIDEEYKSQEHPAATTTDKTGASHDQEPT